MIHVAQNGALATVTLDRSPLNTFDEEQVDALAAATVQLREAPEVALVLLRGAGGAFCAGADIGLLAAHRDGEEPAREVTRFAASIQGALAEWEALELPTVAVLTGAAVGAGLELALACDLRVASHTARIGLPEASLGLIPGGGGTQRLTRLVGTGRAKRLMFGAELVGGEEAERLAIVEWAAPDDQLEDLVDRIVAATLAQSPDSLREIKRCVSLVGTLHGFDTEIEAVRRLHATPDTAKRIQAFLDASPPISRGSVPTNGGR